MKKRFINHLLAVMIILSVLPISGQHAYAASYMSNKTEIPVDLEVSGAEDLCQTEDGYIWIAQYSGLTRYDSKALSSKARNTRSSMSGRWRLPETRFT